MKVKNLQVDGFGLWTELDLQGLSHRVTVVFGANETGKTTLMQFVRTMLYGFAPERRSRYLPPVHGGRPGGSLDVEAAHGGLRILRHLDRFGLDDESESLIVRAADGADVSTSLLSHLLSGVDEATFNNVFAVGLRELQELGTLDDTKAADLLYKLTTGLDRVSLIDVMRDLRDVRQSLCDAHRDASQIPTLLQRRDQLRQRIEALGGDGRQWVELQSQLAALDVEAGQLERRVAQWDEHLKVLEVAIRVHGSWSERRALQGQLDAIGPLREVPATSLQRLDALRAEAEQAQRELAQLQQRRREFRREVAAQPVNRALWSQASHIEALVELAPWIVTLQAEVNQTRVETTGLETRLQASAVKLGRRDAEGQESLPALSPRALAQLHRPARAMRDETRKLQQAQAEHDSARQQLGELTAQLEAALLEHGQEDLAAAIETAGSSVAQLRRRAQLDTRVDQLTRQWDRLRKEHRELLERQVLSPATLAWLGVPFVVGVALLAGGVVWSRAAMLGWPMAVLGLFGWLAAVFAKMTMERAAARELEECDSQLHTLKSQLEQAQKERAELDAQLPRGQGDWDARLATAEKQLAGLEQLLPGEANVRAMRQRALTAKRRVEQSEARVQEARTRWRGALRQLGLPEDMAPREIKRLADGTQQMARAQHQLDGHRETLSARQRELQALTTRIHQLAEKVQLDYPSQDPQVQLQRLSAALAEQQTLYERRQQLRREDRQARRQVRLLTRQLKKARAERRAIMQSAGVPGETQLRELLTRLAERQQLADRLRDVTDQYMTALGKDCPVPRVEEELATRSEAELEQLRDQRLRQISDARAELGRVHQRRGAMMQQSQAMVQDRRLPELRLQLGCVLQQLDESVSRWRVLAVAAQVLELVRQVYESQRQPQTLRDASRYFAALTQGQYVRIWTPLTDMSLRVDLVTGESLPLDVLSSGTREAVFLSLRLALVADFTRRGIVLPLILDDVLVNFDRRRAQAAADVLCDFAERGHQVLLFTCHEHIVELFITRSAEIRCLSDLTLGTPPVADRPAPADTPEPAETVDSGTPEEGDYRLGDEQPVLQPTALDDLLDQAVEQAEVDTDLDDEPLDEIDLCEEDTYCEAQVDAHEMQADDAHDQADPNALRRGATPQRFTWESPERWWDNDRSHEAA